MAQIQVPESAWWVVVHFRERGPLEWPYLGVETLKEDTPENVQRRVEHAKKFPGEKLYDIEPRHKGLVTGSGVEAFNGWTFSRATVQERYTKAQEYEDGKGGSFTKLSEPYRWFTFSFVKSRFPTAQALGKDTNTLFEKMLQRGWTEIYVYNNPVVQQDKRTGETKLIIDFIGATDNLPKRYELGEEIVMGVRKVINTKHKNKKLKTEPILESVEQRIE